MIVSSTAALPSLDRDYGVFDAAAWTVGATPAVRTRQTIVLPEGVRPQEIYAGRLAKRSAADPAAFARARKTYVDFIGAGRPAHPVEETQTHLTRSNYDGTTTLELTRDAHAAFALGRQYDVLRKLGVPRSVAGVRTAAYAHNAAVRALGRLSRSHPAAATAAAVAIAAMAIAAVANRPPAHRRRHGYAPA